MNMMKHMDITSNFDKRRAMHKMRRKRQLRRRIAAMSAVLVLFLSLLAAGRAFAQAGGSMAEQKYKYYTSYEIKAGDSLWSIAETYIDDEFYDSVQDYIEEVKSINGLVSDTIHEDHYLVLPYYSTEQK